MIVNPVNYSLSSAFVMLGAVSTITMIAIGVLTVNGNISSLTTVGSLHLVCGITASVSFLSILGMSNKESAEKWVINAFLIAALLAVAMVGVSTLKGGYGIQFPDSILVTSGKATLLIGSGIALVGFMATKCSL